MPPRLTESPTELPSSGQRELPASRAEVVAPEHGGRGGVGGRSLIYLSGVLTLKHIEGYLNVNISKGKAQTPSFQAIKFFF